MAKRSRETLWLIGYPEKEITGARLPSKRNVLENFFLHLNNGQMTRADAAKKTIETVLPFWEKAGVPTRDISHCRKQVLRLVLFYDKLKNRSR